MLEHIHCRAIDIFISYDLLPWPCSSVGGAAMVKPEGRGFNSHLGQSFPLSLCGPNSITRANAHRANIADVNYMIQVVSNFIVPSVPPANRWRPHNRDSAKPVTIGSLAHRCRFDQYPSCRVRDVQNHPSHNFNPNNYGANIENVIANHKCVAYCNRRFTTSSILCIAFFSHIRL